MKWPYWTVVFLIVLLDFACPAAKGQTITLSGQGGEALKQLVGRRIPGFQLVGVTVCAPSDKPIEFSGGRVYESAAKAGFKWSAAEVATVNLARNANLNWRNLAIFIARAGSSALMVAGGGGIIKIGANAVGGVALGHQFMDDGIEFVKGRVPDPQPVVKRIFEAEARYSLSPSGCIGGFIGSGYPSGPISAVTVALNADSPAWFELAVSRSVGTALADQLAAFERRLDQIQTAADYQRTGREHIPFDENVAAERLAKIMHSRETWALAK